MKLVEKQDDKGYRLEHNRKRYNFYRVIVCPKLAQWCWRKNKGRRKENSRIKSGQKQPPEVFSRKGILRNFAKFTGKHLYQRLRLFFNKVAGLGLWHRCFPVNFAKFPRTLFFTEHPRWLLLSGIMKVYISLINEDYS